MASVDTRVDRVNGGIEAVAIKNLQTILKSRGISSEALFSKYDICLLYTSPSPRDYAASRMPSSA